MDSRLQNALADMAEAITGTQRRFEQLTAAMGTMQQSITDLTRQAGAARADHDRLLQSVENLARADRTVTVTPNVTVQPPAVRPSLFTKDPPSIGTTKLGAGHTDFLSTTPEKIRLWSQDAYKVLMEAQWSINYHMDPPVFRIDDSKREANAAVFTLIYSACHGRARAHVDQYLRQKLLDFSSQPDLQYGHDDYDEDRVQDMQRSAFLLWRALQDRDLSTAQKYFDLLSAKRCTQPSKLSKHLDDMETLYDTYSGCIPPDHLAGRESQLAQILRDSCTQTTRKAILDAQRAVPQHLRTFYDTLILARSINTDEESEARRSRIHQSGRGIGKPSRVTPPPRTRTGSSAPRIAFSADVQGDDQPDAAHAASAQSPAPASRGSSKHAPRPTRYNGNCVLCGKYGHRGEDC